MDNNNLAIIPYRSPSEVLNLPSLTTDIVIYNPNSHLAVPVVGQTQQGHQVTKKTAISTPNLNILQEHAEKLFKQIKLGINGISIAAEDKAKDTSLLGWFKSYIPSAQLVGAKVGETVAFTHGSVFCNKLIDWTANKWFTAPNVQRSLFERGRDFFIKGPAQRVAKEGFKVAANYWLVPGLPYLAAFLGSYGLPMIIGAVYYVVAGKKGETINQRLENVKPEEILAIVEKLDSAEGTLTTRSTGIYNSNNEELGYQDLVDIGTRIMRLKLISQIWHGKFRENAKEIIESYQIVRQDGQKIFLDGALLSNDDKKDFREATQTLTDLKNINAVGKNRKKIKKLINKLADHAFFAANSNNTSPLILCQDGLVCFRDGTIVKTNKEYKTHLAVLRNKELLEFLDWNWVNEEEDHPDYEWNWMDDNLDNSNTYPIKEEELGSVLRDDINNWTLVDVNPHEVDDEIKEKEQEFSAEQLEEKRKREVEDREFYLRQNPSQDPSLRDDQKGKEKIIE